jgi:sugar phosphate isomerase/epimerase
MEANMMKVGFQTISWGRRLEDCGRPMLKAISEARYEGVELMQHPNEFGSAEQLYRNLRGNGLRLLGLAGGSIQERANFIEKLAEIETRAVVREDAKKVIRHQPDCPYIYVDTWDARQIQLIPPKVPLALHPHMFKPVQTGQEAEKLLGEHENLRFLPDTAHLTIAGENVQELLERNIDRIVGVHLKDWASEFGRSFQFYSRGFGVQFGYGDVKLPEIIESLKSKRYNRWIVVEQDVADDPLEAAKNCREWLRSKHGI